MTASAAGPKRRQLVFDSNARGLRAQKGDEMPESKIAAAIVAAQRAFGKTIKNAQNPHLKNRYADLSACLDAVQDALNENGIALLQHTLSDRDGQIGIETIFLHESGEDYRAGTIYLPAVKNDPQGYGSALTYARRYSLMAACGIAPEDDDGNAASGVGHAQQRPQQRPEQRRAEAEQRQRDQHESPGEAQPPRQRASEPEPPRESASEHGAPEPPESEQRLLYREFSELARECGVAAAAIKQHLEKQDLWRPDASIGKFKSQVAVMRSRANLRSRLIAALVKRHDGDQQKAAAVAGEMLRGLDLLTCTPQAIQVICDTAEK